MTVGAESCFDSEYLSENLFVTNGNEALVQIHRSSFVFAYKLYKLSEIQVHCFPKQMEKQKVLPVYFAALTGLIYRFGNNSS